MKKNVKKKRKQWTGNVIPYKNLQIVSSVLNLVCYVMANCKNRVESLKHFKRNFMVIIIKFRYLQILWRLDYTHF